MSSQGKGKEPAGKPKSGATPAAGAKPAKPAPKSGATPAVKSGATPSVKSGATPAVGAKPATKSGAAPAVGSAVTAKIKVVRSAKNYGLALSGKIGSKPELEQQYVHRFTHVDPKDGVLSLREAVNAAYDKAGNQIPAAWANVLATQEELAKIKEKLLAAGYTMHDLMKLTLDNS